MQMAVTLDLLAKTLLDAPIGYVEQTVSEITKKPARLDVTDQNSIDGRKYVRKIIISVGQFPIVRATVRFDTKIIPKPMISDLLQKKYGIGTILRKYHINAQRSSVVIDADPDGKRITRNYGIVHNSSIWFEISEETRLDLLSACQNS